jgi:hypothetical protein
MVIKTRRRLVPGKIELSALRQARSGKSRTLSLRLGTWLNNFATFRQTSCERVRSQALVDWLTRSYHRVRSFVA